MIAHYVGHIRKGILFFTLNRKKTCLEPPLIITFLLSFIEKGFLHLQCISCICHLPKNSHYFYWSPIVKHGMHKTGSQIDQADMKELNIILTQNVNSVYLSIPSQIFKTFHRKKLFDFFLNKYIWTESDVFLTRFFSSNCIQKLSC